MCTLVIAWCAFEGAPIVVAANRDEQLNRPSRPPARREGPPAVVSPRDERAGGTWIGYNDASVFAGVANRWTDADLSGDRSRGLLVDEALEHRTVDAAVAAIEAALVEAAFDAFNLLIADTTSAVLLSWDGRLEVTEFAPGVHVVTNAGYDERLFGATGRADAAAEQLDRARLVRDELRVQPAESASAWLERAGAVLGDHDYGVCVHGDGYGTQSSSLLLLRNDGSAEYRYADGPPCRTPFESVNPEGREGQS